tara:strand:- start:82870 stop:83727 length:858 start_codon:yes stop_codon:yes gene_type:complete
LLQCALCCFAILFLTACGNHPGAPVEDRYGRTSPATSGVYYVQRGETLYSIAFRYGLDYRRLAAANGISPPYTIYPGQRLALSESTQRVLAARPDPAPANPQPATKPAPPVSSPASTPVKVTPVPPVSSPSSKPAAGSVSKPVTSPPPAPATRQPSAAPWTGQAVSAWRWPAEGRVTRGYSSSVHKGIDIGGQRGDPVVAVADGKVVYAGTGIVGFGELLIIKHNELYLSAYGHNHRLLVAEGQVVYAGQKIAEKGSSGTDSVKLHFEIRKQGKPIDPQRLLPRR